MTKRKFHYLRWPALFLFAAIFMFLLALFFKLRHWFWADQAFIMGWMLLAIGAVIAIIKLLMLKKKNHKADA